MKIELEIPDKYKENTIRIFGGIVSIAILEKDDDKWQVKVGECNMCGLCCMNLTGRHLFPIIKGQCVHLLKRPGDNPRWECGLRINRPFGCCVSTPQNIPECTEKYEVVI